MAVPPDIPAGKHALDVEGIEAFLRDVHSRGPETPVDQIKQMLAAQKANAVAMRDELRAKELWCLETTLSIQTWYVSAFALMGSGDFYQAWCALERAEVELGFLRPHCTAAWSAYRLDFIETVVVQWQRVYPYRIFMSPEFVETTKLCSICERPVSLRSPCGHRVGEIYGGELCCRIIVKAEMLSMSFVESPVQKYSVPFSTDPETGGTKDQYDYTIVSYVRRGLREAFDGWKTLETKRRHPHARFRHVGRNEPCPCESGNKYKKCCLGEPGVLRPHLEVVFEKPPPPDHPPLQYTAI